MLESRRMRPILFTLGSFQFAASPVFAGLGAILAYAYFKRNSGYARLSEQDFWNLMFCLAFGTLLGGFVLYFFFYGGGLEANLRYLARHRFPRGGAYFGSFWGALIGAWLYSRRRGLDFAKVADLAGTAAPLSLAVTRVGCLMQACCHGTATSLAFPFAVVFTDPRGSINDQLLGMPLHPTQVYEGLGAAAIFAVAHFAFLRSASRGERPSGLAFGAATILYACLRFGLDFIRGRDPGVLRWFGLTTAQITAVASVAVTLALLRSWKKSV